MINNDIEELADETSHCSTHGVFSAKVTMILGTKTISKCPVCTTAYTTEQDSKKKHDKSIEKQRKIEILFPNSQIQKRFQDKSFDNFIANCSGSKQALKFSKKFSIDFIDRHLAGCGVVFCGNCGTGKSHLAAAIAKDVKILHGKTVVSLSVMQAMRRVKETYSKNSEKTEGQAIYEFNYPDLLILDEVGVQFGSETEKMILFEIINGRYQNMLPTILISNLSLIELNDYIGERVVDRLREGGGAVIPFDWDSYRGKI